MSVAPLIAMIWRRTADAANLSNTLEVNDTPGTVANRYFGDDPAVAGVHKGDVVGRTVGREYHPAIVRDGDAPRPLTDFNRARWRVGGRVDDDDALAAAGRDEYIFAVTRSSYAHR